VITHVPSPDLLLTEQWPSAVSPAGVVTRIAQETLRRFTFDPAGDGMAVWTPDGRQIVFESGRAGMQGVYKQAADGTGTVERLSPSTTPQWSTSITPDGAWVAGFDLLPRTPSNVIFLPLARAVVRPGSNPAPGQSPVESLAETRFRGDMADFSPNGRYIAYASDESGRYEIYVRPFRRVDNGRWQVSTAGGTCPVWARRRPRAVLSRCVECAHRCADQYIRTDDRHRHSGEAVRHQVCRAKSLSPFRRVG
jgi:hypothetical protein